MQCYPPMANSTSASANLKHHYDSLTCQCEHSLSSEANHYHQSETAGYLTNQLQAPSYNQATFNHNTQKELEKAPSQRLMCQSSHRAAVGVNDGYIRSYPQPHFRTLRSNQRRTKDRQTTQPPC